jgi:RuvA, C-terminal domain/HNH endonuclease
MLCEGTYRWDASGGTSWAAEAGRGNARGTDEPWREVHRKLQRIAKRRGALDGEELQLIRTAIALCIWRPLGMTSIREYLEAVMGYGPGVASERVRVAEALDAMSALEHALETGELPYSAVREITRIATSKTERAWVDACRGKNLREIEDLVAEREPGDRPESPRNPDRRMRTMKFEARPATWANVRLARQKLEAERGERLDQDELLDAMAQAVLAGCGAGAGSRAHTQVAVTICRDCGVARQTAAGTEVALRPEEIDCALCDAEWIDLDGERRARQDVTPAVRKVVRHRDRDRCRVPGCRAAQNIDVHHIVHRAQGGSHHPENLLLLCSGHHKAHHRDELRITGAAVDAVFTFAHSERKLQPETALHGDAISHVGDDDATDCSSHVGDDDATDCSSHVGDDDAADRSSNVGDDVRADALRALEALGFTRRESRGAVDHALASEPITGLEALIRAALRQFRPGS